MLKVCSEIAYTGFMVTETGSRPFEKAFLNGQGQPQRITVFL